MISSIVRLADHLIHYPDAMLQAVVVCRCCNRSAYQNTCTVVSVSYLNTAFLVGLLTVMIRPIDWRLP